MPQCPGELCWRECKLLAEPPMPDRSKGRGQTKCSPWSSRLGVRCGANNPTPGKINCYKTSEAYGGGQDPHRVVAPVKKKMWCPSFVFYSICVNSQILRKWLINSNNSSYEECPLKMLSRFLLLLCHSHSD
jgi:hypothetical protein